MANFIRAQNNYTKNQRLINQLSISMLAYRRTWQMMVVLHMAKIPKLFWLGLWCGWPLAAFTPEWRRWCRSRRHSNTALRRPIPDQRTARLVLMHSLNVFSGQRLHIHGE
mmetsp:Transcript_12262/g.28629  ORF Transcript_12262/g.28629 Transcript_12262/m.28629 type:complete len:110 (+) Transcript_12262:29-358(+)